MQIVQGLHGIIKINDDGGEKIIKFDTFNQHYLRFPALFFSFHHDTKNNFMVLITRTMKQRKYFNSPLVAFMFFLSFFWRKKHRKEDENKHVNQKNKERR